VWRLLRVKSKMDGTAWWWCPRYPATSLVACIQDSILIASQQHRPPRGFCEPYQLWSAYGALPDEHCDRARLLIGCLEAGSRLLEYGAPLLSRNGMVLYLVRLTLPSGLTCGEAEAAHPTKKGSVPTHMKNVESKTEAVLIQFGSDPVS